MRWTRRVQRGLALSWLLLMGLSCRGDEALAPGAEEAARPSTTEVVAVVDGEPISRSELEAPLRIELHDLEVAAWKARRQRLARLVRDRLGPSPPRAGSADWGRRVDWRLERPEPPRFALSTAGAAILGRPEAPVVVTIFVDFTSPHVRALQPALVRLRDVHGDAIALAFRQLPLPYHRFALPVALAARCADAEGRFGDYAEALFRVGPEVTPEDLSVLAARAALEPAAFEACRSGSRVRAEVDADLALAATLGVHRAPTVFVNGLYLSGSPDFEAIDEAARRELARLGEPIPDPGRPSGKAAREPTSDGSAGSLPEIPPDALAEPELVLALDRSEVTKALAERDRLAAQLEPTRGEFSGERLLKVREVAEGDFFSRLGLRSGDVLLAVNGAFVTVDHDHFLDAFVEGDVVRLLVMRRGRPHTWEYRVR